MATLGYTTVPSTVDFQPASYLIMQGPYTVVGTGSVVNGQFYASAPLVDPALVRALIYADSSGTPGALVAVGEEFAITAGTGTAWRTLPIAAAPTLTNGVAYWIGWWTGGAGWSSSDVTSAHDYYNVTGAATQKYKSGQTYSSTNPPADPFPSSPSSFNGEYGMYLNYTPTVATQQFLLNEDGTHLMKMEDGLPIELETSA